MAFSTTSYFAGVGTVFAAITLGFMGGAMITSGPKVEPANRVERVAAAAPLPTPQVVAPKSEPAEPAPAPVAVVAASPPAPAPVAQQPEQAPPVTQQPVTQQPVAQQPAQAAPIQAKADEQGPRVGMARDRTVELKRTAERQKAWERRLASRRQREDIDGAANAATQMQRDGVGRVVQRDDDPAMVQKDKRPAFGFFGND